MANPGVVLILTGLFVGIVAGIVLCILGTKLWRRGKALIVFLDPDARQLRLSYRSVRRGKLSLKDREILVDGNAKHGGIYSGWIIDPVTGQNFRAPTRAERTTADPILSGILQASNPEAYYYEMQANGWERILRAGEDKPKNSIWVALGVIGLFALFAILGSVVYIISKLQSANAPGV